MKNRVLITGAKGFIGRNLVKELESKYKIITFEESDLDGEWKSKLDEIFEQGLECVFHIGACSDTLEQNVDNTFVLNYKTDVCIA